MRLRGTALAIGLMGAAIVAPRARAETRTPDPWFGRDKALHFSASATLAGAGYGTGALLSPREPVRVGAGASLSLAAGFTKEILDRYTGGHPSWRDMTWNCIGAGTGLLVAWVVDRLWR